MEISGRSFGLQPKAPDLSCTSVHFLLTGDESGSRRCTGISLLVSAFSTCALAALVTSRAKAAFKHSHRSGKIKSDMKPS